MERGAAPIHIGAETGKDDPAENQNRAKIAQLNGDPVMQALNTTYLIERVGHGILNGFLLAAIPAAFIATLIQAL
jgi:hypothetical protein